MAGSADGGLSANVSPDVVVRPAAPVTDGWPYHAPDEIEAVQRVLASGLVNYWTGNETRSFEEEFASYHGVPHAVALANGTVALQAALSALGIGPGDEVVVPARTYVATATVPVLRGARPVFADVDRESGNLTADTIEAVLTPRTRAVIVVHLGGWPCEMDPILDLARDRRLSVIEDCAQSHGARYKDRPVGSLGQIGAFSFCQDKIITTGGEGGMVITADETLWQSVWSYKDHGKSWEAARRQEPALGFRWLHDSLGTNWRLTEIQAAIGRLQLRKLDGWVQVRRGNARLLAEQLRDLAVLRIPEPADHIRSSYYRFYVHIRPERLREVWSRDRILAEFAARRIPALSGSCPEVYRERVFEAAGLQPRDRLPVARELGETSIAFPVHPTLSRERLQQWGGIARDVLRQASR